MLPMYWQSGHLTYPLCIVSRLFSVGISLSQTYRKHMIPPSTQNNRVAPTLLVACMIVEGVENIPVPIIRFTISSAVDTQPSFLSKVRFSIHHVIEGVANLIELGMSSLTLWKYKMFHSDSSTLSVVILVVPIVQIRGTRLDLLNAGFVDLCGLHGRDL